MSVRVQGRQRAVSVRGMLAVTASIPLCLTACSTAASVGVQASELRASAESDLLEAPAEQSYTLSEMQLLSPDQQGLGDTLARQIDYSGTFELQGGVMTSADLSMGLAGFSDASFHLTEPAVLGRDGELSDTVTAVGTLTVGGVAQPQTGVELTPTVLTEQEAEFDIRFAAPDNLMISRSAPSEIVAHVVFTPAA